MNRLKSGLLTLVLLALLSSVALLTHQYQAEMDVTLNARNTLSAASFKLLKTLDEPITVTAYIASGLPIRQQIAQLIKRYQNYKTNISLSFIDPKQDIEASKRLNIGSQGLIVVTYKQRMEKIAFLNESSFTNALLQLSQDSQRWVSFLAGHGERAPNGKANFDFGRFSQELARRHINAQTLNLAQMSKIPDNTALLVLTAPRVALLAGEITLIKDYIEQGGNLLILTEPDNPYFGAFEQHLGVTKVSGIVVDTGSRLYGIDDPSFVLVSRYNRHPVTKGMQSMTVFPVTAALTITKKTDFSVEPILKTIEQAWTEQDEIKGEIKFDKNTEEVTGILPIGMALTRNLTKGTQQRIIIIGDGDFLSNTFLGNVGNLNLGLRLFNWLIHDDQFIDIPVKIAHDKSLHLTTLSIALMGFGFLFVIPLSLVATGFFIWYKRKHA
ncbi:MAG: Gldg family protein [Methylococcales bacterium]|nr:Gldg family protein [Methylococcales bacterium]